MDAKFTEPSFADIAFLDLDAPIDSKNILNIRSQLLFDQFSHFIYDFEVIKKIYRDYKKRLNVCEINCEMTANTQELKQLEKNLDEIPFCMLNVERIYETIVEQISNISNDKLDITTKSTSESKASRKSFEIAAFGKTFRDMTDKFRRVSDENSKIYSDEIIKLEMEVYEKIWRTSETISIERRQILNYFMGKVEEKGKPGGNFHSF